MPLVLVINCFIKHLAYPNFKFKLFLSMSIAQNWTWLYKILGLYWLLTTILPPCTVLYCTPLYKVTSSLLGADWWCHPVILSQLYASRTRIFIIPPQTSSINSLIFIWILVLFCAGWKFGLWYWIWLVLQQLLNRHTGTIMILCKLHGQGRNYYYWIINYIKF